jgi:hypothetical protein
MEEIADEERAKYFLLEFTVDYTTIQRTEGLLTEADNDKSS